MRWLWILCLAANLAAAEVEEPVPLPPVEQLQVDAVNYVQAQAAALSGHYTFRVVKPPSIPRVPGGSKLSFEPANLSRRDLGGMFFLSFRMKLDGRPAGMLRVDMEGKWTGQLLRARAALARKTIPEADQFEASPFEGSPPAGALSELPAGYRLRSPVAAGHLLTMLDLETIPVVTAGDQVRVELVSGSLVIAAEAVARSSGAVGEKVRLEMPTTHKNVQAVVTGPGEARVLWAGGN
jgi:flagella basal body P-ring formation protein FlgA